MEQAYHIIFWVLLFVLGSCIFSFLNVVIYRVPRRMDFVRARSICPNCGHQLGVFDLIPVVSYLTLRGKCRYCGGKIGIRDTLLELFGGGLALFVGWYFRQSPATAAAVFLFLCVLHVVTWIDIDTMEIPDGCHLAILILAAVVWAGSGFLAPDAFAAGSGAGILQIPLSSRLIGAVCVSLPMLLVALAVPGGFGGGDIKLMAVCGLFLGWRLILVSTALAILAGGLWGILLMALKKKDRKDHFAFGPFLCAGMTLGLFVGQPLAGWYLGLLKI